MIINKEEYKMKKLFIFCSFVACIIANNVSKSFDVKGMHCGFSCVKTVEKVITSLEGVKTCNVDFNNSMMTVEYDTDILNSDKIIASIHENTTYQTRIKGEKKSFWSKFKDLFSKKS